MDNYEEFMFKNNKNIDEFKKLQFIMKEKMILVIQVFFIKKFVILIKHYKCMLNQMMKNLLKKLLKWLEQQKMKKLINILIDFFLVESKSNKGHHFLTKLYILLGDYKKAYWYCIS